MQFSSTEERGDIGRIYSLVHFDARPHRDSIREQCTTDYNLFSILIVLLISRPMIIRDRYIFGIDFLYKRTCLSIAKSKRCGKPYRKSRDDYKYKISSLIFLVRFEINVRPFTLQFKQPLQFFSFFCYYCKIYIYVKRALPIYNDNYKFIMDSKKNKSMA